MYKAILTQTIIDASNITETKIAKKLEIEAKIWIFGNSQYFQEVCHKGEIEPGFVIKIAKEAIKLNLAKGSVLCEGASEKRVQDKRRGQKHIAC